MTAFTDVAPVAGQVLVLIVDDDPGIRGVLTDLLEDEGYATVVAVHGGEALEVLSRMVVDVVLLDMRMPVMDGWEFSCGYSALPGPDGCLAKPREYDAILDVLGRASGQAG